MSVYPLLLKYSNRRSAFRIIATIVSVVLATFILASVTSLGQGWLLRQQKIDFLSALFSDTRETVASQKADQDSIYLSAYDTDFQSSQIKEIGIRINNHADKLPAELDNTPPDGELWVTPALKQLIDTNQSLRERYKGFIIKDKFPDSLAPSPDSLMLLFYIPDSALNNPRAQLQVTNSDTVNRIYNEQKEKNNTQTQLTYTVLMVVGVILALPIFILVIEVAYIGMTQREKRYAALSLVGATTKQVRTMIILEAFPIIIFSVMAGLLLFLWVGAPALSCITIGENTLWVSDLGLPGFIYGLIGVLVVICALLANLQAIQQVKLSPLTVSRKNGVKKHPSIFTIIPLLLGVSSLYFLATYGKEWYANNMSEGGLLIAMLLFLIILGIFLCGPYITYLSSFALARLSRHAEGMLAAHRLRYVSRNTFRSISGIVIALFLGSLLVIFMATIRFSGEAQNRIQSSDFVSTDSFQRPLQIKIIEPSMENIDDALVNELESDSMLKNLSAQMYVQRIFQEHEGADSSLQGEYYDSCQQLQKYTQMKCRDDFAGPVVTRLRLVNINSNNATLQREVTPVGTAEGKIFANSFVIVAKDQAAYNQLIQLTENTASMHQRKTGTIVDVEYDNSNEANPIAYINNISSLTTALLAVVIVTGGLSIMISVISSVYERKKTFIQLRILGAGLMVQARTLIIEVVSPLIVLSVITVGLSVFCSYYLLSAMGAFSSGITFALPGAAFWLSLLGANLLCVGLSLIAVPVLAQLIKEEMRVE